VLLLLTLVTGCVAPSSSVGNPAPDAPRAERKRIVAAIRGEPLTMSSTMNSAGSGGVAGVSEVEKLVHAGMADIQERTPVAPRLAEALPSTDNGLWKVFPDGRMELTWKIRQDARWHDGTPLTADDLLFTVKVEQDEQLAVLTSTAYKFVQSVTASDARTVVVVWKQPYIQADTMFSSLATPLPKHILEKPYTDDWANFAQHPYWTREWVGLGPYKLKEWVLNSHLVVTANDQYPLGKPRIDEIEVRFILDPQALIANVLAGAVDLTLGRGLSLEQGIAARDQWREGHMDAALGNTIVEFPQYINPDPAIMLDPQARRALMYATDREELVDALFGGAGQVVEWIGPHEPEYQYVSSAVVKYGFDPRRASQLFESLGLTKGSDGMYRLPNGQPFKLENRTTSGDDVRGKTLLILADQWQRTGITPDPVVIPRQRSDDREYRATRPAFELVRQPISLTESGLRRLHSAEAALPENDYRRDNRARYMNPEFDSLAERYLATIPLDQRMDLGRQIVHLLSDQLVVIPLYWDVMPVLIHNRLKNVNAATDTRNAHQWDV
jgi:peptide/nickel transport system substrate-binding protein